MVAANDTRLRVTMTRREDVVGRPLCEVFPDKPTDPGATSVKNLQASLKAPRARAGSPGFTFTFWLAPNPAPQAVWRDRMSTASHE